MDNIYIEEMHPLENPLILDRIFDVCSVKDLKAVRQVSKQWRSSSLKQFRSSHKIVVSSRTDALKMSELVQFASGKDKTITEMPFTSYKLCDNYKPFWKICGKNVHILELQDAYFKSDNVKNFRDVIYNSCRNMKQLTLSSDYYGWTDFVEEPVQYQGPQFGENLILRSFEAQSCRIPVSWMEFLNHYPALDSIKISGSRFSKNCNDIFRSLNLIRNQDSRKLNLKHISTEMLPCPEELVTLLTDSNLHFESICINLDGIQVSKKLHHIFANQINFLKALKLDVYSFEGPFDPFEIFPDLSNNQFLNLEEITLCSQIFTSLSFLRATPNLRKLTIERGASSAISNTKSVDMFEVILKNCKELILQVEPITLDNLHKLMNWLPNVQVLKMGFMDDEQFIVVCERWRNLVALVLNDNLVDDQGFTGLDKVDVKTINNGSSFSSWRPITVPRLNIASLKYLKTLSVVGRTYGLNTHPTLGYCSVVCGIQKLSNLKHLNVRCSDPNEKKIWEKMHLKYPMP